MAGQPTLSTEDIDALLRFLPILEANGFVFGQWDSQEGTFPHFNFSAEADRFHHCLYDNNWIVSFDWPGWQAEAERLCASPEMLERADLETIRKLLTLHVRKERFCEGHLLGMFESGHLTNVLRRLRAIRRDMT